MNNRKRGKLEKGERQGKGMDKIRPGTGKETSSSGRRSF